MKKRNISYKGTVLSAILGGAFFTVPYLFFEIPILYSLGMAVVAFGAGNLLFSENENKINTNNEPQKNINDILDLARKQNAQIYAIMNKVEDDKLVDDLKEVHETVKKIIDTVEKNPKKLEKAQTFFSYYLPVTLKIMIKYDDIENQELISDESKKIMDSTEDMISKISKSFKMQLASLYEADIIDTDAEIKVFNSMLNSDGFNPNDDFDLK